jgi:hypothetical protein
MENDANFAVSRLMLTNFSCQTKCQRVILLAKDKRFRVYAQAYGSNLSLCVS